MYYGTEKPLPKNREKLYRLVRVRSAAEKKAVNIVLEEFFTDTEDGWRNTRADAEIAKVAAKSESARNSAAVRWQSEGNANASKTHVVGNAPKTTKTPVTNNQEPRTREKGAQRSRGSRLPAGWFPSEPLKAWAEKERPDLDAMVVIAKFRDYWIAIPGSKGSKLDWDATFRNWVRAEKPGGKSTQIDYEALAARLEAEEIQRAGV